MCIIAMRDLKCIVLGLSSDVLFETLLESIFYSLHKSILHHRNTQWGLTQNPIWNSQNPIQQAPYVEILGVNSHIYSFHNAALINLNFLIVFTYLSGKKVKKQKKVTLAFLPIPTEVKMFWYIFICCKMDVILS